MPPALAPVLGIACGLLAAPLVLAIARRCSPTAGRTRRDVLLAVAGSAVAGGMLALRVSGPALVPFAATVLLAAAAATVDLRDRRLPDVLTWPAAAVALGGLGIVAAVAGGPFLAAAAGAAAFAGGLLVLGLTTRGVGLGDVKAAIGIGALLGWQGAAHWFVGVLAGLLLLVAVGLVTRPRSGVPTRPEPVGADDRVGSDDRVAGNRPAPDWSLPYGPAMLLGALVGL